MKKEIYWYDNSTKIGRNYVIYIIIEYEIDIRVYYIFRKLIYIYKLNQIQKENKKLNILFQYMNWIYLW